MKTTIADTIYATIITIFFILLMALICLLEKFWIIAEKNFNNIFENIVVLVFAIIYFGYVWKQWEDIIKPKE